MEDAPLPNENTIYLKSDKNNIYKIKFTANDNCLLIQSIQEFNNNNIYEDKIQLNEIKLNKYFSICDSIYDVLYSLKPNLSNNIKLEEIFGDLKLTIPLNHPLAKEISFNLKIKQKDNSNEIIQKLYNIVNSLTQKVENQQKEIDNLKNRVKTLENQNKDKIQITEEKPSKHFVKTKDNNNFQVNFNDDNNLTFNNKINNPISYKLGPKDYSYIMRKKEEE